VIGQLKQDIQERLDELLAEADKLRRALIALEPRQRPPAPSARPASDAPVPTRSSPKPDLANAPSVRQPSRAAGTPSRSASGATKTTVLGALSNDGALTAGEVAKATGLGRATVSTTLSKLAKSGEIAKAQRGYRLPKSTDAPDSQGSVSAAAN
jgi:biotin operon repressor